MTRTKSTYLALVAVLLSPMAANADLIGDIDCFGTGFVCADGFFGTGSSSDFFTFIGAMTADGTSPNTDFWSLTNEQTWTHNLVLSGTESLATLVFRTFAMADQRGPYDIFVNGLLVGTTSIIDTGEVFTSQQIITHSFDFSSAFLSSGANIVSMTKLGGPGDSWALDYAQLSARAAVPEPGTLALLGIGLLGMGAARRRKV